MNKKSKMTLTEAVMKSLNNINTMATCVEVYNDILKNDYYDLSHTKVPTDSVSSILKYFILKRDSRLNRIKNKNNKWVYYLTKNKNNKEIIKLREFINNNPSVRINGYDERDLHPLLSTYLNSINIYSKTIYHEKSISNKDNNQIWIHPDMIGVSFSNLSNKVSRNLLNTVNCSDTFKLNSYEIKKNITCDSELKKAFFQAVSNSSWANYGYLAAFKFDDSLMDEMSRLNDSFGIGIIELNSTPYQSKVLFPSKFRNLDFKTIDKICNINKDFEDFINKVENHLATSSQYEECSKNELIKFCDSYFQNDQDIDSYCKRVNIPIDDEEL